MGQGKYASETKVSPEKSLGEIRDILRRYGASRFAYIEDDNQIGVAFEANKRRVRFVLTLPEPKEFTTTPTGKPRAASVASEAYEQAIRQRWRALALVIKAKLESIASGIETFDEAFMAQLVLPSGETMSQWAKPQIEQAYLTNTMPPLLLPDGR